MLNRSTREAIAALLIQREEGGHRRGLFDRAQIGRILVALDELAAWLAAHKPERLRAREAAFDPDRRFSHRDALLIAYVDHVEDGEEPPAVILRRFFDAHLAGSYSHLHVLPHFPCPLIHPDLKGPASRADGGFAPMSYRMDPKYGAPADLRAIEADLMLDFVINHLSTRGDWFRGLLSGDPAREGFFVTIPEDKLADLDLSAVFRPRAHHPVIPFADDRGETRHVWCTFSAEQADIEIKNPDVFIAVMEALVKDFVGAGAVWIRLDAVGYLVKMLGIAPGEPKTSCFGIPETHAVLKAMNLYLRDLSPAVTLVAEVNAAKDEIATYYGTDGDEAHLVYEFPLAPLSLFAIYRGDAAAVLAWATERLAHPDRIGLAFTASHDGIGLLPMADVPPLPDGTPALDFLIRELARRGAGINVKSHVVDRRRIEVPYEACITWTQALVTPEEAEAILRDALDTEAIARLADRITASVSFAYSAPHCVPADYLGALAALFNDEDTFARTGHNRDKNRGLISATAFAKALEAPITNRERLLREVFLRRRRLLAARRESAAFSPHARCLVDVVTACTDRSHKETDDGPGPGARGSGPGRKPLYSVFRFAPDGGERLLALTNSTPETWEVTLDRDLFSAQSAEIRDLLSGRSHLLGARQVRFELAPWAVAWLRGRDFE